MFQFTNKNLIEKIKQEKIKQEKIKQEKIKQEKIKQEKIKQEKIHNYYIKNSQVFKLKENCDSIIPLDVYTCWHTKDLPPLMKQKYE
jgi:hypothetical protein